MQRSFLYRPTFCKIANLAKGFSWFWVLFLSVIPDVVVFRRPTSARNRPLGQTSKEAIQTPRTGSTLANLWETCHLYALSTDTLLDSGLLQTRSLPTA